MRILRKFRKPDVMEVTMNPVDISINIMPNSLEAENEAATIKDGEKIIGLVKKLLEASEGICQLRVSINWNA